MNRFESRSVIWMFADQHYNYDGNIPGVRSLNLTKALKVIIIEGGMVGGVVVAGYTLPDNTPLKTFAIASVAMLVLGNVLMIRALRIQSSIASTKRSAWTHILRAFAILTVAWLLVL